MPADVTWAPGVVEAVGRRIAPRIGADFDRTPPDYIMTVVKNRPNQLGDWRNDVLILATAALSASPLPEAVALIERFIAACGIEANALDIAAIHKIAAPLSETARDAAAFLARVREG